MAALYAAAALFIGLSHASKLDVNVTVATYAIDGALDLCLTDDGMGKDGAGAAFCDACRLTAAPGFVPPPLAASLPAYSRSVRVVFRIDDAVVSDNTPDDIRSRAPPAHA